MYWKYWSTATALLTVPLYHMISFMNKGKVTVLIHFDLFNAFGTVDHNALFHSPELWFWLQCIPLLSVCSLLITLVTTNCTLMMPSYSFHLTLSCFIYLKVLGSLIFLVAIPKLWKFLSSSFHLPLMLIRSILKTHFCWIGHCSLASGFSNLLEFDLPSPADYDFWFLFYLK